MWDQDSPWKELLDARLPEALAFFAPEAHADLDWSRDHEPLDQELRKLVPESHTGKRVVDKLVKVFTRAGDVRYIHLEVQSSREADFAERVYTYNYRLRDRFNQPVCSIPILTDDDPAWRPHSHTEGVWTTRSEFSFRPVKVLDWAGKEEELATDPNLVGLFVLAHLASMRTRRDLEARAKEKVKVIHLLYRRKLDAEEVRQWYRYFDWLLALPREYDAMVNKQVTMSEEKAMPYVSYNERVGESRGLLFGIQTALELKFKDQGLALLPHLQDIEEPEKLRKILLLVLGTGSVEEVSAAVAEVTTSGTSLSSESPP